MRKNKPSEAGYQPGNAIAALWLDAARARARTMKSPFKGRGELDALNTAIENELISIDQIEEIFSESESVNPIEISKLVNRLWALNNQTHFPLQPIEIEDTKLIVPPDLATVLREYVRQLDEVALMFKAFLPDAERKGTSHRDGNFLSISYNPGARVSPDEYRRWIDQWLENGPPKEMWHREIAISVKLPEFQKVFDRWNKSLAHPRKLTPNGVELIGRRPSRELRGEGTLDFGESSKDETKTYPTFDIDKLLQHVEELFQSGFRKKANFKSESTKFATNIIGQLAPEIFPMPEPPDQTKIAGDDLRRAVIEYRKEQSAAENFQTEWVRAFAALNDISYETYGRDLSGLHAQIVREAAMRSLLFVQDKRLNSRAAEVIESVRPTIKTGPISKPVFER